MATKVFAAFLLVISQAQGFRVPEIKDAPNLPQVLNAYGPEPSERFRYQEQLSEDYTLYWNFNATHITFEVVVKTNGWVGFGLSPKGAMKSSDVVIGWVLDSQVHFADRHAEGHFLPVKDSSPDWTLVEGKESGQYTILKMVRLLDTCDDHDDLPILPGTTRVIYAYSDSDPTSDDAIRYHGSTRGTKSILLLDPSTNVQDEVALPSDVKVMELRNGNTRVPSSDTTYWCTFWKLPQLDGKHHMIRYEPIIQAGNEQLVHHLVLHYCTGNAADSAYSPSAFQCYRGAPWVANNCRTNTFLAWAVGGKVFNFPSDVGYSFGGPGDASYLMLETHYDNPYRSSGLTDDSGLRLYLTRELREHDAGSIMVGVSVGSNLLIPPYQSSFLSQGFCGEDCLSEGMGQVQEINVFANLLHAHLIGAKLRTRHFRNGTELSPLQEDNNYDFDYQETRSLTPTRTIKKGDSLLVECEFDSTGRTGVTYGGLSSREEMCLSFLMYYPRISLTSCQSSINYATVPNSGSSSIYDFIANSQWSDPHSSAASELRRVIDQSSHIQICAGDSYAYQSHYKPVPKMGSSSAYRTPSVCAGK